MCQDAQRALDAFEEHRTCSNRKLFRERLKKVTDVYLNAFKKTLPSDPRVVMVWFENMEELYEACLDPTNVVRSHMTMVQCLDFLEEEHVSKDVTSVLKIPPPPNTKTFRRVCVVFYLECQGNDNPMANACVDFPDVECVV